MHGATENLGLVILAILGFITVSVVGQLIKMVLRFEKKH